MNNLKTLRKARNLSQKEIAKDLNISQNGYSQYETEKRTMSTITLKRFARYFNTSIDCIVGLTDIITKYPESKIIPINSNMTRLKDIREDKDLLQKDIGNILGITRSGYKEIERCANDIPINKLIKLALFYNVPIDYILYATDERIPHKRKINFI